MSLFTFVSKRPTAVFEFLYAGPGVHYRTIAVPSGQGRFRRADVAAARQIADRRLSEQFGEALLERERREQETFGDHHWIEEAGFLRANPHLHHEDNYAFSSVIRIR